MRIHELGHRQGTHVASRLTHLFQLHNDRNNGCCESVQPAFGCALMLGTLSTVFPIFCAEFRLSFVGLGVLAGSRLSDFQLN